MNYYTKILLLTSSSNSIYYPAFCLESPAPKACALFYDGKISVANIIHRPTYDGGLFL